jgi:sarcosine oxidase subunit beta
VLTHYHDLGVEYEEWDNDELRRRIPIYDTGAFWPPKRPSDPHFWDQPSDELSGAIFTPGSGYVNDPQLATHNLQRAAEAHGGEFLFKAEVAEIRRRNGSDRVQGVTLADGHEIEAPIVVNVAGPHSFVINRMAGVEEDMKVKTRALRHEVHHVPAPPGFDFEADGFHTSDGDTGIYFRPESGNHILIGSEDPECDPRVWVDEPDRFDRGVTEAQWEAQVYRLARRIPSLRIPHERKGIVDLYDVSDDWIPIYDKSDLGGYYMAIGTSGNQFKNAPVVGYLMAELIDRVEHGHEHDQDPVKVPARYTGVELDAGFYSRLREINPESSFSVNG